MSLIRLDHVAIEVPSLNQYLEKFVNTGGFRLLRRGAVTATGASMAMLGDRNGTKIELIENANATSLRFLHVAFCAEDVGEAARQCSQNGWSVSRGPLTIEAARARSAFMTDEAGFEFQILSYESDSPDIATW
jgi:predicted enzyme related to lactoylglutathione lyase